MGIDYFDVLIPVCVTKHIFTQAGFVLMMNPACMIYQYTFDED
jgi:hypothetical protein